MERNPLPDDPLKRVWDLCLGYPEANETDEAFEAVPTDYLWYRCDGQIDACSWV